VDYLTSDNIGQSCENAEKKSLREFSGFPWNFLRPSGYAVVVLVKITSLILK
jgi:hypothetical protein